MSALFSTTVRIGRDIAKTRSSDQGRRLTWTRYSEVLNGCDSGEGSLFSVRQLRCDEVSRRPHLEEPQICGGSRWPDARFHLRKSDHHGHNAAPLRYQRTLSPTMTSLPCPPLRLLFSAAHKFIPSHHGLLQKASIFISPAMPYRDYISRVVHLAA